MIYIMPQQSQRNWTIILVVPSFWNPYPPMMGWSFTTVLSPKSQRGSLQRIQRFRESAQSQTRPTPKWVLPAGIPENSLHQDSSLILRFPTNRYDSLLVLFFHEKCLLWKRLQFLSRMCSEVKGAKLVKSRLEFEVWISHGVRCDLFHRQGVNRFLRSKQK